MLADRTPGNVTRLETQARVRTSPPLHVAVVTGLSHFARHKPLGAAGGIVLLLMILVALLAPWIAPRDPFATHVAFKYAPPGGEFLLGGDQLGRDVLSRLIYGARISLRVGVFSVLIGITAGTLLGIASAYAGGKVDLVIQRLVDALMAFPPIILALGLMAARGASENNVIIALVAILLPGATRVVRSQALSIKELDYTLAARAIGAGPGRIMLRHILPNVMANFIVLSTISLGFAIIIEASLSFLGVGISPDIPTWGGMLTLGASKYVNIAPWLAIFPGIAIAVVVFSVNLLGDALRDVLDPKLRGR
ncbi:MAG TPA: ABC transporter permease [Dehalococcoidia bacterium]|nr:ABC transporter permease [Dehalococcoidia bacterium]